VRLYCRKISSTTYDLPQIRHVLVRGGVERVRQDRLVGAARQPERRLQRRVHPQRQVAVRDRFGPSQQADEDHLQLLDRAVLDHLLLEPDPFLEWAKEPDPAQIPPEQAEARMPAVVPLALAPASLTLIHGTPPGSDCLCPFSLPRGVPFRLPRHRLKVLPRPFRAKSWQLITAVAVLPGNAQDQEQALELVEQAEENAEASVEETVGDCAYGDSDTRRTFADAGRKLIAKVPQRRGQTYFPKDDFRIDLETLTCTCPGGQTTQTLVSVSSGERYGAPGAPLRAFRFDAAVCAACPLRASCVRAKSGRGRLVMLHPEEALLQAARAFQRSDAFAPYRRLRQVAEHRLARLMQLGARQARYVGRTKTLCQLLLAATVANLTLVATQVGLVRGRRRPQRHLLDPVSGLLLWLIATCCLLATQSLDRITLSHCRNRGFRLRF
jgi:DDE family transposase